MIESSYEKMLEQQYGNEWNIGETKFLEFESGKREVTLTRIIEDYSANRSIAVDFEKGKNDYPNILTLSSESGKSRGLML